jgi:hypothetical protein
LVESRNRFLSRPLITALVTAVLALSLVVLTVPSFRRAAADQLRLSMTHIPERVTELYFTEPAALPAAYETGQPVQFSFTVRNLEHRDMRYRYQLAAGDTYESADGVMEVKDGASAVMAMVLPASDYGAQPVVTVRLPDQGQAIHFRMARQ